MSTDLKLFKVFSALGPDALRVLEKLAWRKKLEKDEMLIWAGEECRAVYFVLSGMVEVFRLAPSGREQTLETLGVGEGFNLVPVFLPTNLNPANVRALAPTDLLCFYKKEFLELLDQFPGLTRALAACFAGRLAGMVNMIESLSLFSVRQRLAAFLIRQADQNGEIPNKRWTQEDIARQLGSVRDVIGRTLRKFADEGLLRFQRQHILLLDRAGLLRVAEGEE